MAQGSLYAVLGRATTLRKCENSLKKNKPQSTREVQWRSFYGIFHGKKFL